MKRFNHKVAAVPVAALLTAIFAVPSCATAVPARADQSTSPVTTVDHATAAAKYEQEATELQAKADYHASMAADYRARIVPGNKQAISYFTLANHCDQRAGRYRKAALETRHIAEGFNAAADRG